MPRTPRALLLLSLLAATSASCSWSRFDDVRSDPPVVLLDRPSGVSAGFATSLASAPGGSSLLVGGQPLVAGAALFELGSGDPPSSPARTLCADAARCRLVGTPVPIVSGAGTDCYVYAVGKVSDGAKGSLLGSCGSGSDFTLEVPADVETRVIEQLLSPAVGEIGFLDGLSLASSGNLLVAGSPDVGLVWLYGATGNLLTSLSPPPSADGTFGIATAVAPGHDGGALVAVSAPGRGQVHLFDVGADGGVSRHRCVSRAAPWGVVMTIATEGPRAALVVSDGTTSVDVLDLGKMPMGEDCVDPAPALVHQLHCTAGGDVAGCGGAGFGYSLASADVDGDGSLELLVGVPGLDIRGVNNAGGVQVFSLFGDDPPRDTLFVAGAKHEDRLGTSVAAVRIAGRDVVAAGLPGSERQEVALFYCSALGGAGSASPRCR